MARTPEPHTFTVTGSGPFPFDMLRYDSCWPSREGDSAGIERTTHRRTREVHVINMRGLRPPTTARWASFGWEASTP